ncbi:MAG: hypothetical protein Q8R37_01120 [Nanoarchaeota archaeon]|nr:hypothetical protein [Nanoarchaeota archaeon]
MARKDIFNDEKSKRDSGLDDDERASLMQREVNIAVSPRKMFKGLFVIVLLVGVFFLGRLSANNFELTGLATQDVAVEEAPEEPAPEEAAVEEVAVEVPEEVIEESQPLAEEETVAAPEEVAVADEPIITTYSKVSVVINKVDRNWMDDWGKIIGLSYTINNGEEGTIKPGSFKMSVEGYTDESSQKIIPLAIAQQTITSGQKVSASVEVPNGYAYNPKTAGNLKNVRISIIMFDLDGKPMASYSNEFDLNG